MDAREAIEQKLEKEGALSSADVAGFGKPEAQSVEKNLSESAVVKREKTKDRLVVAAGDADRVIPAGSATIEVTPADKSAFLAALIGNERMKLTMTRFGGKLTVAVRSRTVRETDAIIKQLQRESRAGKFNAQLDQTIRLRTLVMAFQVAELNGTEYEEQREPLVATAQPGADDDTPEWVSFADSWYDKGDAVNAAVWGCVQEFEDKYWMMTENADKTDFWPPVASI
jgi:hypothetical protein